MGTQVLEAGKCIYEAGMPVSELALVKSGKVKAIYPGGSCELGKGDVLGIVEVANEVHFLRYEALEQTELLTYGFTNLEFLRDLMAQNPEAARVFLRSLFRQITYFLNACSLSEPKCSEYYTSLFRDEDIYISYCKKYHVKAKKLEIIDEISTYLVEEAPDLWLSDYYEGLNKVYGSEGGKALTREGSISIGMVRKGSLDCRKAIQVLDEHFRYLQQMAAVYFPEQGEGFYDLVTDLYEIMEPGSEDAEMLAKEVRRISGQYESIVDLSAPNCKDRIATFERLSKPAKKKKVAAEGPEKTEEMEGLQGSLEIIADFLGRKSQEAQNLIRTVKEYMQLEDPDSTEDEASHVRKELIQAFYPAYSRAFFRSMEEDAPLAVKMFLYFGYVDEKLAGAENVAFMTELAQVLDSNGRKLLREKKESAIYTLYDWLRAIYKLQVDPSRDEFEQDYLDFLHKQRIAGSITVADEKSMERDPVKRAQYELKNLFPTVNKITFGRITTFCPIFTARNAMKKLEDAYVSPEMVEGGFRHIKSIDYSAFYREGLDTEHAEAMGKEEIHREFLPNVILMPNVGLRGVSWQEIEGRKRNSPGRMFMSIFHLEDVETTMMRMTGDFRWEMCKRIQGVRWNDVSDRSLTSEYFDYVQFYRKNRDLSPEAKEKIHASLQRAKNSFKEMFVRDYLIWVLFEGNGSPRLNKVAREILFKYCPFPEEICETLGKNPLYTDLVNRRQVKMSQRLHTLENLTKKIVNSGMDIPPTLEAEILFTQGKV